MAIARQPLDKSSKAIRQMFSQVAPRYDLLNRLLSGRRDVSWRRCAAAALELAGTELVLDVCCGTGDQALAVRAQRGTVVATDFSIAMLALARRKYRRLHTRRPAGFAADALHLPLPSNRFDAVTVSFGLRNVASLEQGLSEIHRVLAPGGRLAILEFAIPTSKVLRRAYLTYFRRILPSLGSLLSPSSSAYSYLSDSVMDFPQRGDFTRIMQASGFEEVSWRDLTSGIVCLYTGRVKP